MKTLYILRHGKSSWPEGSLPDAERPLKHRGEVAARKMGETFAAKGWMAALALVSTARRTRETSDLFLAALAPAGTAVPFPRFLPELYLAPPADIAAALARHGGDAPSVLVIGHNPGLHDLVAGFAEAGCADGVRARLAGGFPTCALARVELSADDWGGVLDCAAEVTDLLTPKSLDHS